MLRSYECFAFISGAKWRRSEQTSYSSRNSQTCSEKLHEALLCHAIAYVKLIFEVAILFYVALEYRKQYANACSYFESFAG